jgi:HAD superfamily hydrolase (TIGR01509 family)
MNAYIFDLDGTLLDSTGIWLDIDMTFLNKRGILVPADYADKIAHLSFPETADYTIRRFGLRESAAAIMQEWMDMAVDAYSHSVSLKPFAKEYLLALKERGAKLAVATSATPALYVPALHRHGIDHLFDIVCNAETVGYGKARPDIFLQTAKHLGVPPQSCMVFEDLLVAVKTAESIDMKVYGVLDEASKTDWAQIRKVADGTIKNFYDAPLPRG